MNFSGTQVEYARNSGHSYKQEIASICDQYGISPSLLKVELTETALLQDLDKAKELFDDLASIGVQLSVDDFGTGFSSLSLIKMLPVTSIKIDGSFVQGLPHSASDCSIVSTLVSLAQGMKVDVVAECVETADQFDYIKGLDGDTSDPDQACETLFQGYHFHKPSRADDLEDLLATVR